MSWRKTAASLEPQWLPILMLGPRLQVKNGSELQENKRDIKETTCRIIIPSLLLNKVKILKHSNPTNYRQCLYVHSNTI
jgi:hypothetical protein